MSDVLSRELPAPKRWQELESLAFDVYSRIWKTTDVELHGRTGQPQAGVDVYGTNRVEQLFTGVQCKGKDSDYGGTLTEAELRAEVKKALTFVPPLDVYIVLTTAPNDIAIQKVAREITVEHRKVGLFEVRVTGWDTFRHHVASHQDLLTKYFADFAPVDVVGQISAASQQNAQGIARLEGMLRTQQRVMADIRDDQTGSDELASRITEISRLTGDGSPYAALNALERIDASEGATASPLARYRLLASKGNAHFALGNEDKAVEFYRQAYGAYPELANAKATLAMALHMEGDHAEAFQLAREAVEQDATSTRNAAILIDVAPETTTVAELQSFFAPEVLADIDIKIHLAVHATVTGDAALHRQLAEEVLAAAPDDWRALSAVGEALMQPLNTLDGLALTHAVPDEYQEDVERAIELMTKAWTKLTQRDSTFQGRHVAANLISLLEVAGREAEADAILDEALVSNSTYAPLVVRGARRSASSGDWSTVAAMIDALPSQAELSFDGFLLRAQAALAMEDGATAIRLCDQLDALAAKEPPMIERDDLVTALRTRALILTGGDRDETIAAIIAAHPESIVLRSLLFDMLGKDDPLRARLATEIGNLSSRDLSLRERVHAAETLYAAGSYSVAADIYKPLHAKTDSHALRRRLQALHLADRRADARKLFESLPKELRTSPGYRHLGIGIYERAGLLKPALALIEKSLEADDELDLRLGWIQLLTRLGRQDEFRVWLEQIPVDIIGSPGELMNLARIIDQHIGRDPRSLIIGYRALRARYSRPRMHLNYAIGLVIMGKPAHELLTELDAVEVDTGIELLNEATGQRLFRLIESAPDPVLERGELAPDDPFAKRLLGLKVGDTVDIDRLGLEPEVHRVAAIQSKYLFAHLRTLRDFQMLFPGNPTFGSFTIDDSKGEDRFEEMFTAARRRADHGSLIEGMYRESSLPLPMVAKFGGTNVFELWDSFSADPSLGLKSAIGAAAEFDAGRMAALDSVVVVDPASIYAWVRMGIAATILKTGIQLAVVQSTIDALRELVEERSARRGQKTGTFGWDGQGYRLVELTEEAIESQIDAAQQALALAGTLLLVPAESDQPVPEKIRELVDEYHPAYRDTLLAVAQPNRTLLTDDLGLRVIAQEVGATFTWTQALAQAGHGPQGISHPEYRAVIAALVRANYVFTQFGPAEILGELLESGWAINERLEAYAQLMTSASLERGSIARLLGQLILDSSQSAPNFGAFAVFHIAFTKAMRDAGLQEMLKGDYEAALQAAYGMLVRSTNRLILRSRLLGSTNHTSPIELTRDVRRFATRQAKRMWQELLDGGLDIGNLDDGRSDGRAVILKTS